MNIIPSIPGLIEIYTEGDSFYVADIVKIFNNSVLLLNVNRNDDGISLLALWKDDITLIRKETRYAMRINSITSPKEMFFQENDYEKYETSFDFLIDYALKNNEKIEVTPYAHDFTLYGKPISYSNKNLEIEELDGKGRKDGVGIIDCDEIESIIFEL